MTSSVLSGFGLVVIKTGSSLIFNAKRGPDVVWLKNYLEDIKTLINRGHKVVLVMSGAVALGRWHIGSGQKSGANRQSLASVGQFEMVALLHEVARDVGLKLGQVLLTVEDSDNRQKYLNSVATLKQLLNVGVVPVINENDVTSTALAKIGDNDRLAARVAGMINADALVILSDINGLYNKDPRTNLDAKLINRVDCIDETVMTMAGGSGSAVGTGGMLTKIMAAKMATSHGCNVLIANGSFVDRKLSDMKFEDCTLLVRQMDVISERKRWFGQKFITHGKIYLDENAQRAMLSRKSLLAVGIVKVEGDFPIDSKVAICDIDGNQLAIGLVNYDSFAIHNIKGMRSDEIRAKFNFFDKDEIVHAENIVLI